MLRRKSRKEDILDFLQKLNHEIKTFIKNSLEAPAETPAERKNWSNLCARFKRQRCWEIKSCTKRDCPAYNSTDYRCWLQAGTLCNGEVQGEFARKYRSCFECDVFHIISAEPLTALCENIDILIYHLQNKAIKLRDLAIRDQLTGLYNRHFFNEIIERETAGIKRKDVILSFVMIDLDNLKGINDTHGHLAGDKLLVEAATLIKKATRRSDLVFRFGGDEFLVLMENDDRDGTPGMVARLLDTVDRWNKKNAEAYGYRLAFSVGCSTCKKGDEVFVALEEADARMYQNKKERKKNAGS